jgi:hypothetical protein
MTRLLLIVVCLAAMACGGEELCAPTGKYVLTDTPSSGRAAARPTAVRRSCA